MPLPSQFPHALLLSAAAPSTPLGPFEDSAVAWSTWVTLMGFVGVTVLALVSAGPVASAIGSDTLTAVTVRLSRLAVVLGVLAVPAVLAGLAHNASEEGGYDFGAAWNSLYDGSNAGRLSGLEVTLVLVGAALIAPLAVRRVAARPARQWLLTAGLCAGAVALGTTKFPDEVPDDWGRSSFETLMWMLHLLGGAVWLGGVAGLAVLALSRVVAPADRGAFWSPVIRRLSAAAMSCVAAITLSGLFLYWGHVDGPSQLFTTMYGRVLGVKILIFGALLLLGVFNQFWLHPRVDALRAAGDERPLHKLLVREFPVVITVEALLGMALLFVAPFLHGSARNQAFQADVAKHSTVALDELPKIADKAVSTSTWVWGTTETIAVIAVMIVGYWISGTIARRRTIAASATSATASSPGDLVEVRIHANCRAGPGAPAGSRRLPRPAPAVVISRSPSIACSCRMPTGCPRLLGHPVMGQVTRRWPETSRNAEQKAAWAGCAGSTARTRRPARFEASHRATFRQTATNGPRPRRP
ncbi:copper resistance D family protein [Streptomyces sp. LN590]|uniref:copper resistance D family protein n=1 Tax=Streptomyces sp. LN590 TaxID=3112980 RepID=UPI003719F322